MSANTTDNEGYRNLWPRIISAVGGLFVAIAVWRVFFSVLEETSLTPAVLDFFKIGLPGIVLLYGGYRLHHSGVHPETYSQIAIWCLGAVGVMTVAISLRIVDPSVTTDGVLWSITITMAIGILGGFAIGMNEAQTTTRAREAEQHNREVKQHNREVKQHKHRLQQQNERLEGFSKMLAHELRNPLAIAQIRLNDFADGNDEAFDEVEQAHNRIDEIISVLLLTARVDEATLEGEVVAISDVATDAWAALVSGQARLVIETEQIIYVDPVHLYHLLENLFSNAIENNHEGVTVRIGDLDGGFYVEDNGRGIPEEDRGAVFDAGYTTGEVGIGFGLSFVAQITNAYGWECDLTESESGGARFEWTSVDVAATSEESISSA